MKINYIWPQQTKNAFGDRTYTAKGSQSSGTNLRLHLILSVSIEVGYGKKNFPFIPLALLAFAFASKTFQCQNFDPTSLRTALQTSPMSRYDDFHTLSMLTFFLRPKRYVVLATACNYHYLGSRSLSNMCLLLQRIATSLKHARPRHCACTPQLLTKMSAI